MCLCVFVCVCLCVQAVGILLDVLVLEFDGFSVLKEMTYECNPDIGRECTQRSADTHTHTHTHTHTRAHMHTDVAQRHKLRCQKPT